MMEKNGFTLELATPWCGRLCSIQIQQTVCHICWHFSVPPHKVQSPLPIVPAMDNNPLNPNYRIQILIFFPYMFSIEVVGRICWSIKKIHLPWSLPQFSWPLSFLKHWYNKEKFHADHSSILGLIGSWQLVVTQVVQNTMLESKGFTGTSQSESSHHCISCSPRWRFCNTGIASGRGPIPHYLFSLHTVYRVVAVLHFA